jgi:hypothetical protein
LIENTYFNLISQRARRRQNPGHGSAPLRRVGLRVQVFESQLLNSIDFKRVNSMQINSTALRDSFPSTLVRRRWLEFAVFLLIVLIGVASRYWLLDFPNFKPIAALCLFAGFFFRRCSVALIGLLAIMLISDWQLGIYQWQVTLAVYASLGIACGLGWLLKRQFVHGAIGLSNRQGVGFVVCSLVMSTVFCVLTNMAVWQFSGWYSGNLDGLAACFEAALPFFRWTMLGDLTFTLTVVGIYQLVCAVLYRVSQQPQLLAVNQ